MLSVPDLSPNFPYLNFKYSQVVEKVNKNIITTIADNGKGFDAQIINSGNGLKNMQQRALAIKAKLHIETGPGKGTSITLIMPA